MPWKTLESFLQCLHQSVSPTRHSQPTVSTVDLPINESLNKERAREEQQRHGTEQGVRSYNTIEQRYLQFGNAATGIQRT